MNLREDRGESAELILSVLRCLCGLGDDLEQNLSKTILDGMYCAPHVMRVREVCGHRKLSMRRASIACDGRIQDRGLE